MTKITYVLDDYTYFFNIIENSKNELSCGGNASNDCNAFGDGKNPSNITIPEYIEQNHQKYHVTRIGKKAFYKCQNVTHLTLPNSIKVFGNNCFDELNLNGDFNLPTALTTIGEWSLSANTFQKITIGENLQYLKDTSFIGFIYTELYISPDNKYFKTDENYGLYSIDKRILYSAPSNKEIFEVPATVKEIKSYAFGWKNITSIIILPSVTIYGKKCFIDVHELENITIKGNMISYFNDIFIDTKTLNTVIYEGSFAVIKDVFGTNLNPTIYTCIGYKGGDKFANKETTQKENCVAFPYFQNTCQNKISFTRNISILSLLVCILL